MAVEREVTIKLGVEAAGSGSKAFADVEKRAKSLEDQMGRTSKAMRDVSGGGGSPGGSGAGLGGGGSRAGGGGAAGGQFGGMAMAALGPVMGAMAAIKSLEMGARSAATALEAIHNSEMTKVDKQEAIGEALPIIGSTVKAVSDFRHAVIGTTDEMRRLGTAHHMAMVGGAAEAAAMAQGIEAKRPLDEARSRALASADILTRVQNDPALRKELGDEHLGLMAHRRLDAERELQAQRGVGGIRSGDVAKAQADVDAANRKIAITNRFVERDVTKIGEEDKPLQAKLNLQLLQETQDREKAIERLKVAQGAAMQNVMSQAQAQHELARMSVHLQEEKLRLLVEEEQKIKAGAQAYGQMDEIEQHVANEAARRLKSSGDVNMLTDYEKEKLQQAGIFDDLMKKANQQQAERSPEFREGLRIAELKGPQEIGQKVAEARVNLGVTVSLNEKAFSDAVDEKLQPLVKAIFATIAEGTANTMLQAEAQKRAEATTRK